MTNETAMTNTDLIEQANNRVHDAPMTAEHLIDDLTAALVEANAKLVRAREENKHLRKLCQPSWFYLAGDMSSDRCRFSPSEVIDEDWLWDNRGEGSAVVQIECATPCPDMWIAVRFFTNEEKDARDSDDDYELTEHATEAEARATLAELGDGR